MSYWQVETSQCIVKLSKYEKTSTTYLVTALWCDDDMKMFASIKVLV